MAKQVSGVGKIVETGLKEALFYDPKHPHTEALVSAIPIPDPKKNKRGQILTGDVLSPIDPPLGCRFHTR